MSEDKRSPKERLGDAMMENLIKVLNGDGATPQDFEVARKILKDAGWSLIAEEDASPESGGKRLKKAQNVWELDDTPFE